MNPVSVHLNHISKRFYIHSHKNTLTEKLIFNQKYQPFWALNNISVKVKPGEFVGLIGPNGSGKTTLLRLIAGIIQPTLGSIKHQGHLVSLIELSAGFQPDLTGLENITLNGLIQGIPKPNLIQNLDRIISFADIGDFIYQPTYTYSEGMLLRLSFSIILSGNPDILIFDENLFVGDRFFYNKIHQTLTEWKSQHKTILLSSHNLIFIRKYCDRCLLLDQGKLKMDGQTDTVVMEYIKGMPKSFIKQVFS